MAFTQLRRTLMSKFVSGFPVNDVSAHFLSTVQDTIVSSAQSLFHHDLQLLFAERELNLDDVPFNVGESCADVCFHVSHQPVSLGIVASLGPAGACDSRDNKSSP